MLVRVSASTCSGKLAGGPLVVPLVVARCPSTSWTAQHVQYHCVELPLCSFLGIILLVLKINIQEQVVQQVNLECGARHDVVVLLLLLLLLLK